jgi:proteic killer suppression protein
MDILFKDSRLRRQCNDDSLLRRKQGKRRAELIRRRLDELRAAASLVDIRKLPGPRCHELSGNRSGELSVDLDDPYRLLFEPAGASVPRLKDGGLNWAGVSAVRILGIEDTHG